jgi:peptidoglycan hydrolase-like protein with peptidoglycan-binding domain
MLSFIFLLIFGVGLIATPLTYFSNKNESLIKSAKASKNTLIASGLKLGSNGEQVKILQSALSTDKSLYPLGIVSGYFGDLTRQAVINFQQKYNLPQTGEVDQQTAEKFNEVYGDKTKDYYLSLNKNTNNQTNSTITNNQNSNFDDPDPLINCLVHPNCGGGTRLLRKSVCDQSICCQIGNSWIFYESKDKCLQDQNNLNQYIGSVNKDSKKVLVNVTDAAYAGSYYCYEDKANEITRIQNLLNLRYKLAESCFANAKIKLNDCLEKCKSDPDFYSCSDKCYPESGAKECGDSYENDLTNYRNQLGSMLRQYCP